MADQKTLWQEWKIVAKLGNDAFHHVWRWFISNGKAHPDYIKSDFLNCWTAYRYENSKARYLRLYRDQLHGYNPMLGCAEGELTIISSNKNELKRILGGLLGDHEYLSIEIEKHEKKPTPRLTGPQKKFVDAFIPNRLKPIFHQKDGWMTLKGNLCNVWAVRHFRREEIKIGTMKGDCIGAGPHPGGYWDEATGKWRGGLKVKVCNIDLDCEKNDSHVHKAMKIQGFFKRLGVKTLLITSSDVLKSGATTPGLRIIFPIKEIWYSEFRNIMGEVLHQAGFELEKGKCELFPDSSRGSRLPFGPGSDVYFNCGGWGDNELQRITDTADKGIEEFFKLDAVDLKDLSNKIGIVLTKYGQHPWLEPVEQKGAIAGPLTQRMLGVPAGDDGLSVKALFAYGLPGPNTRYAATAALIGACRKQRNTKEQTKQKVLVFLMTRSNNYSTLVNEGGYDAVKRYVHAAVESLWRKPFTFSPSKSKVLGGEMVEIPLENSEQEFLRQTVEDSKLRTFLGKLWRRVKCLLHASPGRTFNISSKEFDRLTNKKGYKHLLEQAQEMGLLRCVDDSYRVSRDGMPGICKEYIFYFQERLSTWARDAVERFKKFSGKGDALLLQQAEHNNNNCPGQGALFVKKGVSQLTPATDSGVSVEDVISYVEDFGMRLAFDLFSNDNSPDEQKSEPEPKKREEKARDGKILRFAQEFGDLLEAKGVEIDSTPQEEIPVNQELPETDDEDLLAWQERMLGNAKIRRNSLFDDEPEKDVMSTSGRPKKGKSQQYVNLEFDF